MTTTPLVLIAVLSLVVPTAALDIKAITAMPTADNPQYKNKEAWPMLIGDEYFQKETWPKARLLIWGRPGETSGRTGPKIDAMAPANWIDAATDKPADALPDMQTDIIIPDAKTPYEVAMGAQNFACRHLTVGRNAAFSVESGGNFSIFGNLWVRNTGMLTTWRTLIFEGDRNTFMRQDWPADGKLKKVHDGRLVTPYNPDPKVNNPWMDDGRKPRAPTTYMEHAKATGKSTEVIGYVRSLDEVGIKSGTFIVGRDSRFVSMGPASVAVTSKDAKIVLMDGAQCSHGQNQFVSDAGGNPDWSVADGAEVTGGTPDRPLRRDAYLGLGYSNWMNLPVAKLPEDKTEIPVLPSGAKRHYGYGGYNALISGKLIGYPAPGSNARLVVCWQRIAAGGTGSWGRQDEIIKSVFPKILPQIGIWFSGSAKLENVRFDDLQRGGIVAPSMDTFKQWKNISFGAACLSKDPNELVRGYEAEIAAMKNAGPMSPLEPKPKYTTK